MNCDVKIPRIKSVIFISKVRNFVYNNGYMINSEICNGISKKHKGANILDKQTFMATHCYIIKRIYMRT